MEGDRRSQKKVYDFFSDRMFAVCMYYSKSYEEAQDVFQEGFIRVFNKMHQYSGQGSFEGWVRKIFVNCAIEQYRGKKLKLTGYEDVPPMEDSSFPLVTEQMSAEDILKLVQNLTPQYRLVFNLYAIEGYNHKEIADMLGINEGTSKSNLSRARSILQKKLGDQDSGRYGKDNFRRDEPEQTLNPLITDNSDV